MKNFSFSKNCENWTIKKAEHRSTDAFELWCWRRLLRVSWTARRSHQSILKDINLEYSLEGLMLAEAPILCHLMQRADSLEKTWCWERLKARGKGDDKGWDGWMASLTQWTWVWASSGRWWRTGKPGVLQSMGLQRVRQTEWLNNNENKSHRLGESTRKSYLTKNISSGFIKNSYNSVTRQTA